MTEYEKFCSAKRAVDSLSNGLNPFNGEPLPDDTILNNVHVARALFIASEALRRTIETEKKGIKLHEFTITEKELENFKFSDTPIFISEIAKRIDALRTDEFAKKFSYKIVNEWLEKKGYLAHKIYNGNQHREATAAGAAIGIRTEWRQTVAGGSYAANSYDLNAQHFIIDNLPDIIAESSQEKASEDNSNSN